MPSLPPDADPSGPAPLLPSGDQARAATEHLWRALQGINEWIRFADAKAAAVLTANGVLGTLAAGAGKDQWDFLAAHPWVRYVAGAGAAFLIASSFLCIRCLLPRTRVKGQAPRSRLYFHHIALDDQAKFLASAAALGDESEAFREVGKQVWANARVAREKHQEIYWAILLTGGSLCALSAWIVTSLAK